ncbi:hypothetical protein ACOMHN_039521 [Nucella lapillus]
MYYRIFAKDAVNLVVQSLLGLQRRGSSSGRYPGHSGSYLFGRIHGWQDAYRGNDALCLPSPSASWRYGRDLAQVLTQVSASNGCGGVGGGGMMMVIVV